MDETRKNGPAESEMPAEMRSGGSAEDVEHERQMEVARRVMRENDLALGTLAGGAAVESEAL